MNNRRCIRCWPLACLLAAIPVVLAGCSGTGSGHDAATDNHGKLAGQCQAALAHALPDTRIVRALEVVAGDAIIGLPEPAPVDFCRLEGIIEREIGFELWLPAPAGWNGRFLGAGVGGQAGSIAVGELWRGVSRGYASASTDTGHKKSDRHWLLNRPDRAANYAERANHLLAQRAQVLVAAYYGREADNAFFIGCSGGGRQGMTEIQRFPDDYDAAVIGAPGGNTPEMSARRLWEILQHDKYRGVLTKQAWTLLAERGRDYCDARDGFRDGFADAPLDCDFRIASLACSQQQQDNCLTPEQVAVAEKIYGPLVDENGKQIDSGLLPGIPVSPTPVPEPFTPGPSYLATVLFGDGVHSDPHWDPRRFNIARDLPAIDEVMNLNADDPDLDTFVADGGKLLLYHGWADPLVAPQSTIDYFNALIARYGSRQAVHRFARLYMVPGMDHCRGGDVPDRFGGAGGMAGQHPQPDASNDLLSALERWVDSGIAPGRITATEMVEGEIVRTRPLCSYPERARYRGGSVAEAASYGCD